MEALTVLGILVIASSVCVFKFLDGLLNKFGFPNSVANKSRGSLTTTSKDEIDRFMKHQFWKWRNRLLSLFHSLVTGIGALYCFYEDPLLAQDLITRHSITSICLVSFSIGYFIHDMLHILSVDPSRSSYELLLHHSVVTCCFGITTIYLTYVGYAVVALIVEVHSIFLHLRQTLHMLGYSRKDTTMRLVSLVNIGTFIIFRITTLTWMTRWLVINKDKVPFGFYTIGSIGMAIITVINIVLLYRLLYSDFLRNPKSELKKSN